MSSFISNLLFVNLFYLPMLLLSFLSLLVILLSLYGVSGALIVIIIIRGLVGRISRVFMIICAGLFRLIVVGRVMVLSFGLSGWEEC